MHSLILVTASRYLLPLLLMFSVFMLIRGHNFPGGGFIGGLVAAAAFTLHVVAYEAGKTRRVLAIEPLTLIVLGLALALGAGLLGLAAGEPFLTGLWLPFTVPVLGHVGTPLMFDLGVYLVVVGIAMLIIFTLAEES